jgi:hypothetical protein
MPWYGSFLSPHHRVAVILPFRQLPLRSMWGYNHTAAPQLFHLPSGMRSPVNTSRLMRWWGDCKYGVLGNRHFMVNTWRRRRNVIGLGIYRGVVCRAYCRKAAEQRCSCSPTSSGGGMEPIGRTLPRREGVGLRYISVNGHRRCPITPHPAASVKI